MSELDILSVAVWRVRYSVNLCMWYNISAIQTTFDYTHIHVGNGAIKIRPYLIHKICLTYMLMSLEKSDEKECKKIIKYAGFINTILGLPDNTMPEFYRQLLLFTHSCIWNKDYLLRLDSAVVCYRGNFKK